MPPHEPDIRPTAVSVAPSGAASRLLWTTIGLATTALAIVPINLFVWSRPIGGGPSPLFCVLAMVQFGSGTAAAACGFVHAGRLRTTGGSRALATGVAIAGIVLGLGGPLGIAMAFLLAGLGGPGGWGKR
jgi:hypothetical protein